MDAIDQINQRLDRLEEFVKRQEHPPQTPAYTESMLAPHFAEFERAVLAKVLDTGEPEKGAQSGALVPMSAKELGDALAQNLKAAAASTDATFPSCDGPVNAG